jgi:probable F420-dependent oxidoreductase
LIVGVKIGPALDASVGRAAEEAERVGFHSVWLSERVVTPLDKPHPYDPMPDPWIALSYVAAVTERVLLGTSVSMIALRPPVLMARELATLDRLSGGRVIAGVGAGWVAEEFASAGVRFEDRGGRLSESMQVLRHLWTTPDQAWHGKFFDIPPVGIVSPLTPGGPPIYTGGFTEAGYRRAAKYADGFIAVSAADVGQLGALRAHLDELRAKYGRTGPFTFLVQSNAPDTIEAAKEMVGAYRAQQIDGVILTYPDAVPDAFLRGADVVRALVES